MKKYIVVTNVFGKKRDIFGNLVEFLDEEKEYFDTLEEVNEYVRFFKSYCKDFVQPEKVVTNGKEQYHSSNLLFKDEKARLWGYVIGDTETNGIIEWGGLRMKYINEDYKYYGLNAPLSSFDKKTNRLYIKDYVFRGENEIPKNYHWDNGEYEGWLQFRWGDGKNAIDYVEPTKTEKPKEQEDVIENTKDWENTIEDYEDIENSALKQETKERMKILENRW